MAGQGHQFFRLKVIKTRDAFPVRVSTILILFCQTYSVGSVEEPECNEVRFEVSSLSLEFLEELLKQNRPESLLLGGFVSANPETYPESPEDVVVILASLLRGPSREEKFMVASVALL